MPTALRARLLELVDEARRLSHGSAASNGQAILRHLIDPLPIAAFVADNQGRYVAANRAASELTGYSIRELRELSVWDLTPPSMDHDSEVLWRAFLQQGEQTGDYVLVRKDGSAVGTTYAARAHVLEGLHLSLLSPQSH